MVRCVATSGRTHILGHLKQKRNIAAKPQLLTRSLSSRETQLSSPSVFALSYVNVFTTSTLVTDEAHAATTP
jgi:hypothetical protein